MAEKQSNKDRIKEITAGIEKGIMELFESDRYRQYLSTMSRFHKYSLNNVMLIHSQRPDATLVAGFNKWKNQFGRHVKKGERGIQILAPVPFKKKVDEVKLDPHTQTPMLDRDGNLIKEEKEVSIPMFKVVSVFDVSQTDGKPLPVLAHSLSGDVQQYEVFMEALRRTSPVPIVVAHTDRDVDGFFDLTAQQITIQDGMSQVQTICAGVHEIAHSKLHNYDKIDEPKDAPEYQNIEIFGVPGLFSNGRIFLADLPDGLYRYDLRGSDYDPGMPVTVEPNVAVNHAGAIITAKPLDLGKDDRRYLTEEEGLDFVGGESSVYQFLNEQRKDRHTEEVEAESISYAVCQYFGIETADNSFGYIASWSQGKELKELRASLETINRTSSELISSIEHHFKEICKERGIDLAAQQKTEPDSLTKLAADLERFEFDVDTFAYLDSVGSREEGLREVTESLISGDVQGIRDYLHEILAEEDEYSEAAQALLNRLDAFFPVPSVEPPAKEVDAISTYAGDFAVHLLVTTNGEPIPGVPATDLDGITAWAEEKLRSGDLRPLSDVLLDMMAVYGQDERFDNLTDRLADLNKQVYIPEETLDSNKAPSRYEYKLVSNFHRTAPEDTTYIQQYTFTKGAVLIPGPVLFVGPYEKCLELQEALKAGTITVDAVRAMEEAEKLYLVSDSKYLHIQRTDSGFDYTLYDKNSMKQLNGGRLDDPELHISTACIDICEMHGLDSYKVSIVPLELLESLAAANIPQEQREQSIDIPQPYPYISQTELQAFGYTAPDMLPVSTDFALELMERDVTVYMLHSDNTEAMAFDSEDLAMHIGMFGITTEDWNAIKERPDIVAISTRFAVSYQQDVAAGVVKPPVTPENHLRAAEMSMEDDYGMIDGIINNGKAPAAKEQDKEKKPSVLDQLKSQSTPPRQKSTHKKSKGREI